jgi:hypothetical protein
LLLLLLLLAEEAEKNRKVQNDTSLRIGTCHSINLSAADGTAGCAASRLPSLLSLSLSLSLAPSRSLFLLTSRFIFLFSSSRHARIRTFSL